MSLIKLLSNINNWSVSDILSLVSIIIVIIGGMFAYKQWVISSKEKHAEFIKQIIYKLRFEKDIVKTMYIIDYETEDNQWYDNNFHYRKDDWEYKIDALLSYLSYICYLSREKLITVKEFSILQYEINRACRSTSVQNYLWNLYHFSKFQDYECSFKYLIDYGIKNELIDKNTFYNPKSKDYKDVLGIHEIADELLSSNST